MAFCLAAAGIADAAASKMLFDFDSPAGMPSVYNWNNVRNSLVDGAKGKAMRFTFSKGALQSISTLTGPIQDLSAFAVVKMDVSNRGNKEAAILGSVGGANSCYGMVYVRPGATETLTVYIRRGQPTGYLAKYFPGMRALPGSFLWTGNWSSIDPSRIAAVSLQMDDPDQDYTVDVDNIRAEDVGRVPTEQELQAAFFPMIDSLGQYRNSTWPGKTSGTQDLRRALAEEADDLAAHPGASDWDLYGGWEAGPKLAATGHFRTEKYQGKWWLIDPLGRLFWSNGLDCVTLSQTAAAAGKEYMFQWLPPGNDFYAANLAAKYGADWIARSIGTAHQRLRSWGINTVANWSDPAIYAVRKTPYAVAIETPGPALPGLFQPGFRAGLKARMALEKGKSAEDPWCIGYFVDNEISSWPDTAGLGNVADTYYRIVSEEIKAAAPAKLYLGSRLDFHHYDPSATDSLNAKRTRIIQAAAKYCDVVSFNRYRFAAHDLLMPKGVDKPLLIGEFHFGALDRGLAGYGINGMPTQAGRAQAYAHFIRSALDNPALVGAHYFQYADQPYTGRGYDGENSQIGWVDVCDNPYSEMVDTARNVNYSLYPYRAGVPATGIAGRLGRGNGNADASGVSHTPRDLAGRAGLFRDRIHLIQPRYRKP